MRFYFGLSKKIKFKWVITILLGLLAFFGIYKNVNAEELPSFYEINTNTFDSLDSCNFWFAPQNLFNNDFLGGNLSNAPWISTHNLYDDLVFNTEYSNVLIHQNTNNNAYIDIKYHISDDIEHLYFSAKYYYNTYASDRDRPEGASWFICTDSTCSTTYSTTISRTVTQENVYYPNYYINVELPLTYSVNNVSSRYEYFILRLRGSHYGTSTNDKMYWTRVILQNSLITFDTNNDTTLANNNGNYCSLKSNSISLNNNLTDIIIGSINDSLDPLHSAEESLNNGVSINLDENTSFKIPSLNMSSYTQRLFLLPITILQKVVTASESCTPYSINLSSFTNRFGGFNYTLTIPCMRTTISNMIGSTWYNIFDVFLCSFVFFKFAMFLVNQINSFINGDDTIGDIYYAYDETHNHYRDPITHVRYHYNSRTGEVRR